MQALRYLPRSIERGPVEASDRANALIRRGIPFRAQLSAAPLKPIDTRGTAEHDCRPSALN